MGEMKDRLSDGDRSGKKYLKNPANMSARRWVCSQRPSQTADRRRFPLASYDVIARRDLWERARMQRRGYVLYRLTQVQFISLVSY